MLLSWWCELTCDRGVWCAGLRDDLAVNVSTAVQLHCVSADSLYATQRANVSVINYDIRWPVFAAMRPQVSPMVGQRILLTGGTWPYLQTQCPLLVRVFA